MSGDGFRVDDGCSACGQCAAVCPSGALSVSTFSELGPLPGGNTVRIECLKVPAAISGHQSLRVPCLGGLSPSQWLELVEAAGDRRLVAIDRGWCAGCDSGCMHRPEHPASRAMTQIDAILAALGWHPARRPHLLSEPLPAALMPADIPLEKPASIARRAFFRRVGGEAKRATGIEEDLTAETPRTMRRRDMRLPERERLLAATRRLAAASSVAEPATPFVSLSVGSECRHHQLCARLCPTGALSLFARDEQRGLEFDAETCTACGLCARNCPEEAIRIGPASSAPRRRMPVVLVSVGERLCARCRSPYVGPAGQLECAACLRARQLGSALFGSGTGLADNSWKEADAVSSSGGVHHE